MLLLVAKRMLRPVYAAHHHHHHHRLISGCLPRCCYSQTSAAIESPAAAADPKPPNFLADHLIISWGFSPDKAAIISKRLPNLKTPDKPDAVLRFLTRQGFSKSEISTFTTCRPTLLQSSPENTLDPNLRALRDIGLSTSLLTQILLSSPAALHLRSAVPRIKFWRDFLGGDEAALLMVFQNNRSLVSHDITRSIAPKIAFLESQGFFAYEIRRIALTVPRFMTSNIGFIEKLLGHARELGSPTLSRGMFVAMLRVASQPREKLQKKKELFKSFGWSENEFVSAMQKAPTMVSPSVENLQAKMDFLVGELGLDPSYIASHPGILTLSLEKRMRPRHRVLRLLESKGLLSGKSKGFTSAINLSDIRFEERYVLPHEEEIPELREAYLAACAP